MTPPPIEAGDFVWCAFPEREHPASPSRHPHIGYALVVALGTSTAGGPRAIVAYTTSRPGQHDGKRPGVVPFSAEEAAALGQKRPFWLHLWRIAYLPVTEAWFPNLASPDKVVLGRLPPARRTEIEAIAIRVQQRHPNEVERLGPLRPRP